MNDMALASDVGRLTDPLFWRSFAPEMHIVDRDFLNSQTVFEVDDASLDNGRGLLKREGYFQIPPPDWGLPIAGMAGLVARLDATGLPAPFSFMYDEFWCLFFRLNRILEGMLGPGFFRLPDFWTWIVRPDRDDSGWQPHRDKTFPMALFDDGSPKSATVWIPLTDSTPLNGCMYIVPADRDPTYNTEQEKEWRFAYPDIRALPAPAGTIFCWNQAVLHWGSHACTRESAPRVSVAFEFQSGAVPPFNQPLTNPNEIPLFEFRVRLVAKQILQYKHMYPLAPEVERLADEILARPAP
jgi:hypothetical protein